MSKQPVIFRDLGVMDYKTAWDYQEKLLQENVKTKVAEARSLMAEVGERSTALLSDSPLTTRTLSSFRRTSSCLHIG